MRGLREAARYLTIVPMGDGRAIMSPPGCAVVWFPVVGLLIGVAVVLVGLTFVPGFTRLTYDLVGLGPTLWRLTWVLTLGAFVGAGASWVTGRLLRTRRRRRTAIAAGTRVLVHDDLLATGGTAGTMAQLVEELGGEVVAFAFLIELSFLGGRERLGGRDILSLITY